MDIEMTLNVYYLTDPRRNVSWDVPLQTLTLTMFTDSTNDPFALHPDTRVAWQER